MSAIAHVSVTHLYAAAARQQDGCLQEKPVAVLRGTVLWDVCPLAAREGLRPGMTLRQARLACPRAAFPAYQEEVYLPWARRIRDLCAARTPRVEPEHIHSVFLDLTGCGPPAKLVRELLAEMRALDLPGLRPRAGLAASRFVARVAASLAGEEDSLYAIAPGKEAACLSALPVETLWMLDGATLRHLRALGLNTLGEVARVSEAQLVRQFGPVGRQIRALSRGVDTTPVRAAYPPPEIRRSWQSPPEEAGCDGETLHRILEGTAREVAAALQAAHRGCRGLQLQVVWNGGRRRQAGVDADRPWQEMRALTSAAHRLLARLEPGGELVCELTLIACDLETPPPEQGDLLRPAAAPGRQDLLRSYAALRERFGPRALRWGRDLVPSRRERLHALLEHP